MNFDDWYNKAKSIMETAFVKNGIMNPEEPNIDNLNEALLCYDNALKINPYDSNSWHDKGYCLGHMKQNNEALSCYDKAIELDPNNPLFYESKGSCLMAMDLYKRAIFCYDKALKLDSKRYHVLLFKGMCLKQLGLIEECITIYDEYLQFCPSDDHIRYKIGLLLKELNRFEKAISYFNMFTNIKPPMAWVDIGDCYQSMGKYKEAIYSYDKAITDFPHLWYHKGCCLNKINSFTDALVCLNKYLELCESAPNMKEFKIHVLNERGFSLRMLNQLDEAVSCFNKSLEIMPKNRYALYHKVSCLILLGRCEEALKIIRSDKTETDFTNIYTESVPKANIIISISEDLNYNLDGYKLKLGVDVASYKNFINDKRTKRLGYLMKRHYGLKFNEIGYIYMMGKIECFNGEFLVLPSENINSKIGAWGTSANIIFRDNVSATLQFSIRLNRRVAEYYWHQFCSICKKRYGAGKMAEAPNWPGAKSVPILYWEDNNSLLAVGYNSLTGCAGVQLKSGGVTDIHWF